ncbi:TPA: DUF1642 domain-containing protein [Streptococcus suis]|nr:DUF1642 domain-containing protein [Streptococcus suis]
MNKKEVIKLIEQMGEYERFVDEPISKGSVLNIISQIHEPQKVVVPEFIDSYIRYAKAEGMSLFIAMNNAQNKESEWIIANEETFARAWFDGYGVEKEKLYTVEIPDPNSYCNYRYLSRNDNGICLDASNDTKWKQKKRNQFTESEIKEDFEWAWQFAKEVE